MKVWLNGALFEHAAAGIDPADRGLLLGDGVFETILVRQERPHHLARHLQRLRDGAAVLGITVAWSDAALQAAAEAVVTANRLDAASLRLTLTRGAGGRGVLPANEVAPTLLLTGAALAPMPDTVTLVVAYGTRRNEFSPLSRIKSLNYLDAIVARREAVARGADDALLLNTQSRVAEASAANVFALHRGIWTTPPVGDGALPGIARALLMQAFAAREVSIDPADLAQAESVLLTNSLGVRAATMLDGRELPRRPDLEGLATELFRQT